VLSSLGVEEWEQFARCPEFPNVEFFPEGTSETAKKAIAVCSRCPVINECLEFSLRTKQRYGVWGGTTSAERLEMLGVEVVDDDEPE